MGYTTLSKYAVTLDDSTAGSRKLSFLPYKAGLNTFATSGDWSISAADFKIAKAVTGSGLGAEASIGTAPTWVNGRVVIILSGTELTCRYLTIRIENAAINSDEIIVETYGNASAKYPTDYVDVVRMGMTALPNAAAEASGGLHTIGTGAGQIQVNGSGAISSVVLVTTTTTVTNQLTAAQIATGVWQDSTSGDFTTASSIGKCLYISNVAPGAAGGHFIAGSNAATSITTALTANVIGNVTGNLSGSVGSVTGAVGSVTGAVGSVTGNVGGNVTGTVASVVGAVGSVTGNLGGNVSGNVAGKVLGGGSGTITGTGAWVLDAGGNNVATASALSGMAIDLASDVIAPIQNYLTGDSYVRLGAPAGASVSADIAAVKTDTGNLITRIPAALFAGITSVAQWLGLIAGKQTGNTTARTEVRATGAGSGTFDETTDSQEAIRDRGDSAWTTGAGGGGGGTTVNEDTTIVSEETEIS